VISLCLFSPHLEDLNTFDANIIFKINFLMTAGTLQSKLTFFLNLCLCRENPIAVVLSQVPIFMSLKSF